MWTLCREGSDWSSVLPACTLQTAEPSPASPAHPPGSAPAFLVGGGPVRRRCRDLAVLEGLDSCICVFAKEDSVGQGALKEPPSTDTSLPCLSHPDTLSPVGWGAKCPLLVERLPGGGHPVGGLQGWRGRGLTALGKATGVSRLAFYTLQCNFFILFYSDYNYSGILSLR